MQHKGLLCLSTSVINQLKYIQHRHPNPLLLPLDSKHGLCSCILQLYLPSNFSRFLEWKKKEYTYQISSYKYNNLSRVLSSCSRILGNVVYIHTLGPYGGVPYDLCIRELDNLQWKKQRMKKIARQLSNKFSIV